jgi:hypothetical protein
VSELLTFKLFGTPTWKYISGKFLWCSNRHGLTQDGVHGDKRCRSQTKFLSSTSYNSQLNGDNRAVGCALAPGRLNQSYNSFSLILIAWKVRNLFQQTNFGYLTQYCRHVCSLPAVMFTTLRICYVSE